MATLYSYRDDATGRDIVKMVDAEPVEKFSIELLESGRGSPYLMVEGDKITLNMDNGRWVYVVTDVDEQSGVVTARWPD